MPKTKPIEKFVLTHGDRVKGEALKSSWFNEEAGFKDLFSKLRAYGIRNFIKDFKALNTSD